MKPSELFSQLEKAYTWDLQSSEKQIMIELARKIGAGKLIEEWQLFQDRFPGHSVFKFVKNREVVQIEFF